MALPGNITITETLAGQFKLGQDICLVDPAANEHQPSFRHARTPS